MHRACCELRVPNLLALPGLQCSSQARSTCGQLWSQAPLSLAFLETAPEKARLCSGIPGAPSLACPKSVSTTFWDLPSHGQWHHLGVLLWAKVHIEVSGDADLAPDTPAAAEPLSASTTLLPVFILCLKCTALLTVHFGTRPRFVLLFQNRHSSFQFHCLSL